MAVICSRFCIYIQPILRGGVRGALKAVRQNTRPILVSIALGAVVLMGAVEGPGTNPENPDFRMEGDDVRLEILEVHSLNQPVVITVENLGQVSVQALLVDIEDVEPHADRGIIDFDSVTPRGILRVATRLHVDSRLHSGKYHREEGNFVQGGIDGERHCRGIPTQRIPGFRCIIIVRIPDKHVLFCHRRSLNKTPSDQVGQFRT